MTFYAMRHSSCLSATTLSAKYVFSICDNFEMKRVDTSSVTTKMVND